MRAKPPGPLKRPTAAKMQNAGRTRQRPPRRNRATPLPRTVLRRISVRFIIADCRGVVKIKKCNSIDDELRTALRQLALGYEAEDRKIIVGKDGNAERVEIMKRHIPPDLKAIQRIQLMREMGEWEE